MSNLYQQTYGLTPVSLSGLQLRVGIDYTAGTYWHLIVFMAEKTTPATAGNVQGASFRLQFHDIKEVTVAKVADSILDAIRALQNSEHANFKPNNVTVKQLQPLAALVYNDIVKTIKT